MKFSSVLLMNRGYKSWAISSMTD